MRGVTENGNEKLKAGARDRKGEGTAEQIQQLMVSILKKYVHTITVAAHTFPIEFRTCIYQSKYFNLV